MFKKIQIPKFGVCGKHFDSNVMERRSDYFIEKVAHKMKFFISEGKRLFRECSAEYET